MSTLTSKKKYICKNAKDLKKEDRKTVRNIILSKHGDLIKEYPDGTRILLDKVDDSVITEVFNFIHDKIKKG